MGIRIQIRFIVERRWVMSLFRCGESLFLEHQTIVTRGLKNTHRRHRRGLKLHRMASVGKFLVPCHKIVNTLYTIDFCHLFGLSFHMRIYII